MAADGSSVLALLLAGDVAQAAARLAEPAFSAWHLLAACLATLVFAAALAAALGLLTPGTITHTAPPLLPPLPSKPAAAATAAPAAPATRLPAADGSGDSDYEDDDDDDDDDSGTGPLAGGVPLSASGGAFTEWKLVLVIRTDLEMTKGKVAAQCCHATISAYNKMRSRDEAGLKRWERHGQAKITLKCQSESE
ncbi:hypothetical protein HK405_001042, partial [Cladochytrium tenue]